MVSDEKLIKAEEGNEKKRELKFASFSRFKSFIDDLILPEREIRVVSYYYDAPTDSNMRILGKIGPYDDVSRLMLDAYCCALRDLVKKNMSEHDFVQGRILVSAVSSDAFSFANCYRFRAIYPDANYTFSVGQADDDDGLGYICSMDENFDRNDFLKKVFGKYGSLRWRDMKRRK